MDKITKLTELKKLFDDGLLTKEEFDKYKSELISGSIDNLPNKSKSQETVIEEKTIVEENTIDSTSNVVEEDKTAKIQTEKKYDKELNSSQTNHSYWRYILAIAFFLGGGYYIFYHIALKNSNNDEQKTESQEGIDGSQNNSESSTIFEVSKKFIGQTYVKKTKDSFGETTEQFTFEQNGKGAFYVSWTVNSTVYKQNGKLTWEIIEGKIQVEYIYKSSDGISSNEKEILVFDEKRNLIIDDNDNRTIYNPVILKTVYDKNESSQNNSDEYGEEMDYNDEREQAEYESNQAYYNSKEYKESTRESEPKNSKIEETETLYKTAITRSPEPRKDIANVFWKKEYTLFDKLTDEPIFPYKNNGLLVYKIYCSTNESLIAEYVELSPEQLQKKIAYKFLNFENCNKWIESKRRKLNKN